VSFKLIRRSVSVAASAVLLLTLLAPSAALAKTPTWSITVTTIPSASGGTTSVTPGSYVLVQAVIKNTGNSNIAQLYLIDNTSDTLVQATTTAGSCNQSGPLDCNLGSLPGKGGTVTVDLVYQTVTSGNANVDLYLNTTGVSYSDGGTSHGDVLKGSAPITLVDSGSGFAGGYVFDPNLPPISTTGGNQQTTINPPTTGIGVTIQQGGANACNASGFTPIGTDTATTVGNGGPYSPFLTTLTLNIANNNIPDETQLGGFKLCHTYDTGPNAGKSILLAPCASDSAPVSGACFWAKWDGNTGNDDYEWSWTLWRFVQGPLDADDYTNVIFDVWDTYNGHLSGGV
jgi:hypothetical protein